MNEHTFGGTRATRSTSALIPDDGVDSPPSDTDGADAPDMSRGVGQPSRDNRHRPQITRASSQSSNALVERREYLPAGYYSNAPSPADEEADGRVDLRKYFWMLVKHRWLILAFVAVSVTIGALNTFLTTPIYRASATIQINREVARVVTMDDFQQVEAGQSWEFFQTQYELLRSRSLAEQVVALANLQDDADFMTADVVSSWTRLKQLIFGAEGNTDKAQNTDVAARQREAAGRVMGGFSLQPVNESTIVRLNFDSPAPRVAERVVNAVAEAYIASNLDRRYGASRFARTFLEERLEELKLKLEESEKALVAYAQSQDIVADSDGTTFTQSDLTAVNTELTSATSKRLRTELLWDQVQGSKGIAMPQFLESTSISEKRRTRDELSATYEDQLSLFKPAYPQMKKLKAQIDELDRQIADEVSLIRQSLEAAFKSSVAEEASLKERVEELKAKFADFRSRNIEYTILQREVDTNRSLYDGLLQRYKEIGIAGGVGSNNVSIVDRAETPGAPFTPNLKRNVTIALLFGLLLGVGAALAREHLDDTFKSPEDLEASLGVPLLGVVPVSKSEGDHQRLLDDPRSATSEAYRSLRTALQFSTSVGIPRTLLITSTRPAEGKSTSALSIAKSCAEIGMKVLLIDADLRRPRLHEYLNVDNSVGLTNCLAGTEISGAAFQKTSVEGLTFVASGPLPPNPAELIAGVNMTTLLTVAAEEYDLVVLDGPPVAGLADAPLLSSMTTATLFVVDGMATRRKAAKTALRRLLMARSHVIGAVVNKLPVLGSAYGYGYGYGAHGYGQEESYGESPSDSGPPKARGRAALSART